MKKLYLMPQKTYGDGKLSYDEIKCIGIYVVIEADSAMQANHIAHERGLVVVKYSQALGHYMTMFEKTMTRGAKSGDFFAVGENDEITYDWACYWAKIELEKNPFKKYYSFLWNADGTIVRLPDGLVVRPDQNITIKPKRRKLFYGAD